MFSKTNRQSQALVGWRKGIQFIYTINHHKTSVQYCGGCSVHWRYSVHRGDNISTVGDSFSTVGEDF